ncbi:hypothetical protein VTN00DRAFT_6797 [Thermoascus crustaceus]|uniref:uncharacterized protein n=1 Tax=Thermoascus crustaceus TaxID=5088 RepID=UPI00374467D7
MRTEDATIRKKMVSAARSSTVAQSAVDGEAIRTEERQDPTHSTEASGFEYRMIRRVISGGRDGPPESPATHGIGKLQAKAGWAAARGYSRLRLDLFSQTHCEPLAQRACWRGILCTVLRTSAVKMSDAFTCHSETGPMLPREFCSPQWHALSTGSACITAHDRSLPYPSLLWLGRELEQLDAGLVASLPRMPEGYRLRTSDGHAKYRTASQNLEDPQPALSPSLVAGRFQKALGPIARHDSLGSCHRTRRQQTRPPSTKQLLERERKGMLRRRSIVLPPLVVLLDRQKVFTI